MLTAKEWLKANDPLYVSPQAKAAKTREIPFSPDALAAMIGGTGTIKSNGKYQQRLLVGFEGGTGEGDGEMVPTYKATQGFDLIRARTANQPIRRRGKRAGRKHR